MREHPRTRGDHYGDMSASLAAEGTPSHARGPPALRLPDRVAPGNTPARAGTTRPPRAVPLRPREHPRTRGGPQPGPGEEEARAREHPRTRGDHAAVQPGPDGGWGTPPHARGPPGHHLVLPGLSGNTPARAGTTSRDSGAGRAPGEHPRTRGDHGARPMTTPHDQGTPPHARGPPTPPPWRTGQPGNTPARAGTTSSCPCPLRASREHPRTRGDHEVVALRAQLAPGTPPHARGPLGADAVPDAWPGNTPARAGTTVRDLRVYAADGLFLLTS